MPFREENVTYLYLMFNKLGPSSSMQWQKTPHTHILYCA